jgi:hypothetical protein
VHLRLAPDDAILQWAADNARVVVTHDVNTMTGFAYQRVMRREPMPGVVAVSQTLGVRTAIEQLLLATVCYEADDIADQVLFIPW